MNKKIYISDKNKFLTTFNEKASAKKFRPYELKKFQNLHILDVAAGLHHILLFAVSIKTSPSNSLDITSSDANENITNSHLQKSDADSESAEERIPHKSDKNNSITDSIDTTIDTKQKTFTNKNQFKEVEYKEDISSNENIKQDYNYSQAYNMDIVSKSISNIGENLVNDITEITSDIKSVTKASEEKLNDLAKETEKTLKDVPTNVIDYVKTSIGHEEKEENLDVLHANMNEDNTIKETSDSKISECTTEVSDTIFGSVPPSEKNDVNNQLSNDLDAARTDDFQISSVDNEVKFINNGMDASKTSNIIQAMNDEIDEMSNEVKNDELTVKYEGITINQHELFFKNSLIFLSFKCLFQQLEKI